MRLLFIVISFFCAFGFQVNAKSDVLERVKANLERDELVVIQFNFTAYGVQGDLLLEESGVFESRHDMFRMISPSVEVWCDTIHKWIFNKQEEEIMVFKYIPSHFDITENPFSLFKKYDKEFTYSDAVQVKGEELVTIELKPKDKRSPYEKIVLVIDKKSYQPRSVACMKRDKGIYNINIVAMNYLPKQEQQYFSFNPDLYPDAFVTEMF